MYMLFVVILLWVGFVDLHVIWAVCFDELGWIVYFVVDCWLVGFMVVWWYCLIT